MMERKDKMIEKENIPYTQEECKAMSKTIQRLRMSLEQTHKPSQLILREQAAIAAMQGIITSNCDEYRSLIAESYKKDEVHLLTVGIARMAVACADALVEELNS